MSVVANLNVGWSFRETGDDSSNAWAPVHRIPGTIHADLQRNGRIADPFVNMNELSVRWVAERSWTYRTSFETPDIQNGSATELIFEGLDTLAKVKLNEKTILEAKNMFVKYRVNVTDLLRLQNAVNQLEIVFDSALLRGRDMVKEREHDHRHIAHQTELGRLPVRKAQYHWGWDWGPILTTAGIWKPIWLESYKLRIDDVWCQYKVSEDLSSVSGTMMARAVSSDSEFVSKKISLTLALQGNNVFQKEVIPNHEGIAQCDFTLQSPALWYPNGYGGQLRYDLTASVVGESDGPSASNTKKIGFRRVELIQEADDSGKSFYFRINNVDVFAGGSCWIPADSFLPAIERERYREWMELMLEGKSGHDTRLLTDKRSVWGGGIYEDEAFYDACDELGILVWQDFAMACASYPTYPSFLEQIETEARCNIKRLRNHPSLVIWAGNNEDYQIQERYELDYNFDSDKDPQSWLKSSFPARYIYEYLLPKLVEEESPGAVYHPSSPWGDGKKTYDPTVGDTHQWNIWHGMMRRYQEASTMGSRFVSEFGMEAYPHLETVKAAVTDPAQQYPGSVVMDYHNRAIDHERRLMTYVAENFRVRYDLPSFIHLTQMAQADAMSFAYRSWRRQWGTKGARQCGGVLVWQFNDCWPTMSWAIVDYWLVKKPAFYAISRALRSLSVCVSRPFHTWTIGHQDPTIGMTDRRYDVWIASSLQESRKIEVEVRFISIKTGKDVCAPETHKVDASANATTMVCESADVQVDMPPIAHEPIDDEDESTYVVNQAGYFKYPARHLRDAKPFDLAVYDPFVIHVKIRGADPPVYSEDAAWPHPLKHLNFSDRGVRVRLSDGKHEVHVRAEKPVKGFVFEEKRDWVKFSDNGFDLMPGEEKVVKLSGKSIESIEALTWTWLGRED